MTYDLNEYKLELFPDSKIIRLTKGDASFVLEFKVTNAEFEMLNKMLASHEPDHRTFFINAFIKSKLPPDYRKKA